MHATATYTVIDYPALRVSRITNITASRNITNHDDFPHRRL